MAGMLKSRDVEGLISFLSDVVGMASSTVVLVTCGYLSRDQDGENFENATNQLAEDKSHIELDGYFPSYRLLCHHKQPWCFSQN